MCGFVVLDLVSSVLCQEIGWEDNQFMYSVVRREGFPDSTNSLDPPLILTLLRYIIALYWFFQSVLGFCWQKKLFLPNKRFKPVYTYLKWKNEIPVQRCFLCQDSRISSVCYKTNFVTHLCILSHTICCLKCASTQMKTVHLWGQDKIIKVDIVECKLEHKCVIFRLHRSTT